MKTYLWVLIRRASLGTSNGYPQRKFPWRNKKQDKRINFGQVTFV